MSDTYKIVYSKVINRAIRDLVGSQHQERDDALKYMKSKSFLEHCRIAGYPEALQHALDEGGEAQSKEVITYIYVSK